MAQAGYTPVLLYGSTTTGNTPSAANLTTSASGVELAINAFDGKLFYKDASNVVQVLATKGTAAIGGSNTQVQYNSSGSLAGSANLTFDGTSLTLGGNPTLSAGTANGVAYLNGSKVVTTGSALTFDGTNLGIGANITASAAFAPSFTVGTGSGSPAITLYSATTGSSQISFADATSGGGAYDGYVLYNQNSQYMAFGIASSEAMRLTSSLLTVTPGATIQGLTVGRGAGAVSSNTAVGASALAANTTGANNTAIGYLALTTNVSGANNSAFGLYALRLNTGSSNSAFGVQALDANTGSYNTAVGQGSLQANTTASNNTAVGYQAGYNANRTADTSGYNSLFGYIAGKNISTGQVNVFIGSRSGSSGASGITGSANTVVGDFAGNLLEGAASNNALFGQNSGYLITTGSKNTIIGGYSGNQGGLDIRTASNYIVLSDGDGNPRGIFDSSGNLLVGATSQSGGPASARVFISSTTADWTTASMNTHASNPYGIISRYTAAAPNGTANEFLYCQDSSAIRASIRSNGGLANYSANNVNLSDERTKTDIQDAGSYLAKICAIPVRTFKYKDQTDDLLNLGVIAQEVETVAPELVDVSGFGETPEDGVPLKAIYQTDLQYALMKCIQEQQALITQLTERISALESK